MTPNLLVLANPRNWFRRDQSAVAADKPQRKSEHWENPVPGVYEYKPGRGWYLVAPDDSSSTIRLPAPVTYAKALKRWMFTSEYTARQRHYEVVELDEADIIDKEGRATEDRRSSIGSRRSSLRGSLEAKRRKATFGFLRLDDGKSWVACWDEHGQFIPGPYVKWMIDPQTQKFRQMTWADDPESWEKRRSSARLSVGGASARGSVAGSVKSVRT